jgi:hypothetical protein
MDGETMPIRINDASVVHSFSDLIPGAAYHGETYLRTIASSIQQLQAPVRMSIDSLVTDGFRSRKVQCLAVEPTEPRLRHYKSAHYASPSGDSLTVGWYLVGGERAAGLQVGAFSIGAASQLDADEVMSLVELVHGHAVLPAIGEVLETLRYASP